MQPDPSPERHDRPDLPGPPDLPDLTGGPWRFHLIGIGGAGMNGIASMLVAMGHFVSGSDVKGSAVLERLNAPWDQDLHRSRGGQYWRGRFRGLFDGHKSGQRRGRRGPPAPSTGTVPGRLAGRDMPPMPHSGGQRDAREDDYHGHVGRGAY